MSKAATYTVILMVTTVFAKILGFARENALTFVYGASDITDAYKVVFSIPTLFLAGIGTAILTSYIAVSNNLKKNNPKALKSFGDKVSTLTVLLSAVVAAVFFIFDRQIMKLFAWAFEGEKLEMTLVLARIMIVSLLFMGASYVLKGFLQMNGGFFAVGMDSVPLNIAVVASILLSTPESYRLMGWGIVAGYGATFVMLYLAAKRYHYSYRPNFHFNDPNIKRLLVMVLPIFLGKTVTQLNTLIDQNIASFLPDGGISVLSYANRLTGFVNAVFVVSVATAIFPQLSRLSVGHNIKKLKSTFITSAGIMSLLVLPIAAGIMLFSKEIVTLTFERGAFTPEDTQRTAQVLFFYALGLLAFSLKDVMMNVFYAIEDTKTPTINSIVALVLNTVFNLALLKPMAHSGLALATSLSATITLVMLFVSLRKKLGSLGLRKFFISLAKMLVATLGMAVTVRPLYNLLFGLSQSMLLSLGVAIGCGAVVYGVLCILLRTREMGLVVVGVLDRLHIK